MKSNSLVLDGVVIAREGVPLSAPIHLTLTPGQMLAIHGANGSGKSTLLKMLAGLLPVSGVNFTADFARDAAAGSASPIGRGRKTERSVKRSETNAGFPGEGEVPQAQSRPHPDLQPNAEEAFEQIRPLPRKEVSPRPLYLGHKRGLTPSMSVYDNVAFWARAAGHPELTAAAMRYFDLDDIPDVAVETLSAGWQQRVALTRLITHPSPLWLLDEPTANLDSEGVALLQSLMHARLEQGGIILVATHMQMQGPKIQVLNISNLQKEVDVEVADEC
jgi:ABC-type transport system involved in cytochrome c biogenesis ATPase subunit